MARFGTPSIDIKFIQKAVTAVQRSQRGILAIIVKDTTETTGVTKFVYRRASDIEDGTFTAENNKAIKRAFNVAVNKVYVFRCKGDATAKQVVAELEKSRFNYICTNDADYQDELVTYVKQYNHDNQGHKIVGVVANVETKPDSMFIVNIKGTGGVDKDDEAVTAEDYTIRVASTLANLPMNRSLTYYEFGDLKSWDSSFLEDGKDWNYWVDNGWLTLITEDEKVVCGRAVNSLTTFTSTETEDMSHIIIVESMNMILEDIYTTFKDYYVGKYKNSYDNQKLFLSSVNSYFRTLASEEILEPNYDNHAEIDIEYQREKWLSVGKEEAEDWDDMQVKKMPFRTLVCLAGDIHLTDAMEDMNFNIYLA